MKITVSISLGLILFLITATGCGGGSATPQVQPPNIMIESPQSLLNLSGIVQFSGTVVTYAGATVASLNLQVDSGSLLSTTGLQNWVFDLDTTPLTAGNHKLTMFATDSLGESGTLVVDFTTITVAGGNIEILNALDSTAVISGSLVFGFPADQECFLISYHSANENAIPTVVSGYVVKPVGDGPFPCIIYNRDGVDVNADLVRLSNIAAKGYAVLASDYYGESDNGSGTPDLFGTEAYDIVALLKIARSTSFIDKQKIYMWGDGRGSAVAVLALDRLGMIGKSDNIKASAVTSPIYDLTTAYSDGYNTAEQLVINYFSWLKNITFDQAIVELRDRSPGKTYNHDNIRNPMFIGYGGLDTSFPPFHAQALASHMNSLGNMIELHEYADQGAVTNISVLDDIIAFWESL